VRVHRRYHLLRRLSDRYAVETMFPADSGTSVAAKSSVHKISYKHIGAQRDRMREQLLKSGLRLAALLNAIFQ
jgi:hypothetical protein